MIKLTALDGTDLYVDPMRLSIIEPDGRGGTHIYASMVEDVFLVRECPSTVAAMVAKARESARLEWLASAALTGLTACPNISGSLEDLVRAAADYARALAAELDKEQGNV